MTSTKSSICQLPSCNSFTQHVISLWRDTTSELWTPVISFNITAILYCILLFNFLQTILHPHNTVNPLCSAKPVSLTTSLNSWGKVSWLFVCRFQVAADAGSAPYHQSVCNTFRSDTFLLLVDKPWFRNRGKLAAVLIIPSSWGSPTTLHQALFWCRYHIHVSAISSPPRDYGSIAVASW